jgi:hypothetical protein
MTPFTEDLEVLLDTETNTDRIAARLGYKYATLLGKARQDGRPDLAERLIALRVGIAA